MMVVDAPAREHASTPPAFDEPATRDPAEALIEEARRRARRRHRLVAGAVAAATIGLAAIGVATSSGDAPPTRGPGAPMVAPAEDADLGVFDLMRGRIVYVAGRELRAVDPDDPASVHTTILSPDVAAGLPMAAGWSADGTRLALTSEASETKYVMETDGAVTPVGEVPGCCLFVTSPWLSPDGTTSVERVTADWLRLRDLDGGPARLVEFVPPLGAYGLAFVPTHAWSPDGSRIAFAVERQVGRDLLPSIHVVDPYTGIQRELGTGDIGHIRQMAWSPDGSRLLVVGGHRGWSTNMPPSNPLLDPQPADLYLIEVDGSAAADSDSTPISIASGHYVAATWSPDGRRIATVDFAPSGRSLIVMADDGSLPRVLYELMRGSHFTGLAWHPGPGLG